MKYCVCMISIDLSPSRRWKMVEKWQCIRCV